MKSKEMKRKPSQEPNKKVWPRQAGKKEWETVDLGTATYIGCPQDQGVSHYNQAPWHVLPAAPWPGGETSKEATANHKVWREREEDKT